MKSTNLNEKNINNSINKTTHQYNMQRIYIN